MKFFLFFFLLSLLLSGSSASPPKLTNIDFLGQGYDVINGNPHPEDGRDHGFTSALFDFTYALVRGFIRVKIR
jgi:hypothetical protein